MDRIKDHPQISHNAEKMIGEFPTKECRFSLFNRDNTLDLVGKDIQVFRGLLLEDNTIEYIPQGIFHVNPDDIKTNSTAKTIELTIKDKSIDFDCPYGGIGKISYPCTLGQFINEIVTRHNFILETPNFPFSDLILNERPNFDLNTATERSLIAKAGDLGGCTTQMSRTGGVRISKPYLTGITIKKIDYKKLPSKEKQFGPINQVALSRGNTDNDDIISKNDESISQNGLCEWKIIDNPYIDLIRETIIDQVASNLFGMTIIPFELDDVIDSYLYDINDSISVIDKMNNMFNTTILSISSSSRIFTKLKASIQNKTESNAKLAGSSKELLKQVKLDVDHNKQRITALATEVTENTENLAKLEIESTKIDLRVKSTEEKTETLETNLNTTNTKIDNLSVGGRNLILNSDFSKSTNFSSTGMSRVFDDGIVTLENTELRKTNSFYIPISPYSVNILNEKNLIFTMEYKIDTQLQFGTTNSFVGCQFSITKSDGTKQYIDWYGGKWIPISVTNGWIKKSFVINLPTNGTEFSSTVGFYLRDTIGKINFRKPKIEVGNIATDWTPAPEDLESNVVSLQEYIDQNVQNLQNQIDGAIQFWNGPNIPTLSNEPALNWTTEEEKNNHRADIYTVIQDVNGEMKQGKSYRFDKVNNAWQWIELTDNELSAVQALADSKAKVFVTTPTVPYNKGDLWLKNKELYECKNPKNASGTFSDSDWEKSLKYTDDTVANEANDRSKANANEITTLKENDVELQLNIDNITSRVSSSETKIENIEKTTQTSEGGNRLYLEKALEQDALEYHIKGKSVQETTEGKNLLNYTKFTSSDGGITTTLNKDGSLTTTGIPTRNYVPILRSLPIDGVLEDGKTYTISQKNASTKLYIQVNIKNKETEKYTYLHLGYDGINSKSFTVDKSLYTYSIAIQTSLMTVWGTESQTITNFYQLEEGSVATDFEKYTGGQPSPSPEYPSEIKTIAKDGIAKVKIIGANLYNYKDKYASAYSYTIDEEGWITLSYTNDGTSDRYFNYYTNKDELLKPNTQYAIFLEVKEFSGDGNINVVSRHATNELSQFVSTSPLQFSNISNNSVYKFINTTLDNFENSTNMLRTFITVPFGQSCSITFRISVLEDTTITPEDFKYEEYKEREVLIDLNKYDEEGNVVGNYELSSLPDGTSNDLNIVDGQVVLNERVGKVVLDGSEAWNLANINKFRYPFGVDFYDLIIDTNVINCLSDKFIASNSSEGDSQYSNEFTFRKTTYSQRFWFFLPKNYITGEDASEILNNWKKFLSNNNVIMYYQLAETQQIILPNVQIPLFEGTNHISLVEDIETDTSIKYLRETPFSKDYALNVDLDKTNSNLSNTNHQLGQAQSDINATNTHLNNDFYDKSQIDSMQTSTEQNIMQIKNSVEEKITATGKQLDVINETITNGVSKVTALGVTVDLNGMHMEKTGEPMSSTMDWDGMEVVRDKGKASETEVLTVRSDGVVTENMTVRTYFIQKPIRQEKCISVSDGVSVGVGEYYIG